MVLGIPDFWIWLVFLLCIASALACVIYGAVNWNKGNGENGNQIEKVAHWQEEEEEIKQKL